MAIKRMTIEPLKFCLFRDNTSIHRCRHFFLPATPHYAIITHLPEDSDLANDLKGVEYKKKLDGSWSATHVPSGRITHGLSQAEAQESMREELGMNAEGEFGEPATSDRFSGVAHEIATYLEGPVSKMLELHSGYARLEAYQDAIAHVRLGGGCQGCPSSLITLSSGVKNDLQNHFGEDIVMDVFPVLE